MGRSPELSGWPCNNHKVLTREKQRVRVRAGDKTMKARTERLEDATMLTLKMEEGAYSQGRKATFLETRKGEGNGFSLGASGRNAAELTDF